MRSKSTDLENLNAGLAMFPGEARRNVADFAQRFMSNDECRATVDFFALRYEKNPHIDFARAVAEIQAVAEKNGFDVREAHLFLYVRLVSALYSHYERTGLPRAVCAASLGDLYVKAAECHALYGVWGTFVPLWILRFFDMTRFQLGRLQFETLRSDSANPATTVKGVLNVHIPSGSPLLHDDCLASYKAARLFYKKHFDIEISSFHCYSWLLFPRICEFVPENSNIMRFASDWDVYEVVDDESGKDLWRIFGREVQPGSYLDLPEDTTLRRACKKWLLAGNALGAGRGRLVI